MTQRKDDEVEGNLVTAFVAAAVFPKNMLIAAASSAAQKALEGKNFVDTYGETLENLMEKDCKPFATRKK